MPMKESILGSNLSSPHKSRINECTCIFSKSTNSPAHIDCIVKCTCPKISNSNILQTSAVQQNTMGLQSLDTNYLNSKSVADANTSPGLRCIRNIKHEHKFGISDEKLNSNSKDLNKNFCTNNCEQKYHPMPLPSPRRLISTRNAATSPHLDMRKVQRNELKIKEIKKEKVIEDTNDRYQKSGISDNRACLEKSNSLGDSKPNRQLRTTRSLSPRPPIKHQHAITVSDENDIVSVKVSPNDDFESSVNNNQENNFSNNINNNEETSALIIQQKIRNDYSNNFNERSSRARKKHKAKSEQTSPNITDFDDIFTYECKPNNKSTGCLIYVPSDPWLKMSDFDKNNEISVSSLRKQKTNVKGLKLSKESRSLSKGNIDTDDPWVWRTDLEKTYDITSSNNNIKRSPKHDAYRQSKSFSVTKFSELPGANQKINRPKLQRCKSPFFTEDEFRKALNKKFTPLPTSPTLLVPPPLSMESQFTSSSNNYKYLASIQHQETQQPIQQPSSPTFAITKANLNVSANCSPRKELSTAFVFAQQYVEQQHQQQQQPLPKINKTLLNVTNPNLIQSRHSFSSGSSSQPQKNDELQLNIRRLSEQIKHDNNDSNCGIVDIIGSSGGGADFSDYLKQFRNSEAKKAAAELAQQEKSISNLNSLSNFNSMCSSAPNSAGPSSLSLDQSNVPKSPRNTTKNSDRVLETTC